MEKFTLLKIDHDRYGYIIFATSYESPLSFLNNIEQALVEKKVSQCNIVMDLLLSKGKSNNRYIEISFNGSFFDRNSFKFIKTNRNDFLRKASCKYFCENSCFLEQSVLSDAQVRLIKNGIAL